MLLLWLVKCIGLLFMVRIIVGMCVEYVFWYFGLMDIVLLLVMVLSLVLLLFYFFWFGRCISEKLVNVVCLCGDFSVLMVVDVVLFFLVSRVVILVMIFLLLLLGLVIFRKSCQLQWFVSIINSVVRIMLCFFVWLLVVWLSQCQNVGVWVFSVFFFIGGVKFILYRVCIQCDGLCGWNVLFCVLSMLL